MGYRVVFSSRRCRSRCLCGNKIPFVIDIFEHIPGFVGRLHRKPFLRKRWYAQHSGRRWWDFSVFRPECRCEKIRLSGRVTGQASSDGQPLLIGAGIAAADSHDRAGDTFVVQDLQTIQLFLTLLRSGIIQPDSFFSLGTTSVSGSPILQLYSITYGSSPTLMIPIKRK